jgi:hypothetical protein
MAEEEVSPKAGQRPGKIAFKGFARYVLNDSLVTGLETRKER